MLVFKLNVSRILEKNVVNFCMFRGELNDYIFESIWFMYSFVCFEIIIDEVLLCIRKIEISVRIIIKIERIVKSLIVLFFVRSRRSVVIRIVRIVRGIMKLLFCLRRNIIVYLERYVVILVIMIRNRMNVVIRFGVCEILNINL